MESNLVVQKADDSGNVIIKPVPGQVICEFDPTPDAEYYANTFVSNFNKFPNGFQSWQETHFEIVGAVTLFVEKEYKPKITAALKASGQKGLMILCEELTDKFESQYKGEEWIDKDWYDTVDAFLATELA